MKTLNIAYIGGGSCLWARNLMNDLALAEGLCGEIRLYDIDHQALRTTPSSATAIKICPTP